MSNSIDETGIRKLAKEYVINITFAIAAIFVIFLVFGFAFGTGNYFLFLILIPVLPLSVYIYIRMLRSKEKFYNKIIIHVIPEEKPST
jgi:4-hydroxybenzoate polyprenyltransferase